MGAPKIPPKGGSILSPRASQDPVSLYNRQEKYRRRNEKTRVP